MEYKLNTREYKSNAREYKSNTREHKLNTREYKSNNTTDNKLNNTRQYEPPHGLRVIRSGTRALSGRDRRFARGPREASSTDRGAYLAALADPR